MLSNLLIEKHVRAALEEDLGHGHDVTSNLLIPAGERAKAAFVAREDGVLAGLIVALSTFSLIDPDFDMVIHAQDGDAIEAGQIIAEIEGPARSLLTAERVALNFMSHMSGIATYTNRFVSEIEGTGADICDTRKTLPGLRLAQKYAVTCGGCFNHRIGLWDAFLIKENHIAACGSIAQAIEAAHRIAPGKPVEVETENLDELEQALRAGADIIMLDEFSLEDMRTAVDTTGGKAKLEASGGINADTLVPIAETGVDFISIGALTKDLKAVDLSMRLD